MEAKEKSNFASWDGDKANDHFIRLYNSKNVKQFQWKPQDELYKSLHDHELACKELYVYCAEEAWTKERLTTLLTSIIDGSRKIHIDTTVNFPEKFVNTFKEESKRQLNDILSGKLTFNK